MGKIVSLDSRGRLLLPAEVRGKLGTRRFIMREKGEKIELEPLPDPESIRGKYQGLLKVDMEELEEEQEKFLQEGER